MVLHARAWQAGDLAGAAIAVGAFAADDEAGAFAAAARAAGVPVNVIDKPAFCDFSFGSIVNRSPLVIGISTDGAAPVFAQAVRAKLEALIPLGFARWAAAARRWRRAVQTSGLSFPARRRFWQVFTAQAVNHPDREPLGADFDAYMALTREGSAAAENGSVTLVGAGPGDPELLTLRAVRALQSADVILIDDLVAPGVLDFARREAKKMLVGKTGYGPSCKQEEINALMISLAKAGKRVVRLKGGDPMIFGRASEEIDACRLAGIAVEVVPGISAAQGAASRLGISLTHRKVSRRVQYVTGHAADGRLPSDIDWHSLADPSVTTIVYMPGKTIRELADHRDRQRPRPRHADHRGRRGDTARATGRHRDHRRYRGSFARSGTGRAAVGDDRSGAGGCGYRRGGRRRARDDRRKSADGTPAGLLSNYGNAAPLRRPCVKQGPIRRALSVSLWIIGSLPWPGRHRYDNPCCIGTTSEPLLHCAHFVRPIEFARASGSSMSGGCHDDESTQYRANPARGGGVAA